MCASFKDAQCLHLARSLTCLHRKASVAIGEDFHSSQALIGSFLCAEDKI
jgi:hypothetical protein